jgi:hypothetical protein
VFGKHDSQFRSVRVYLNFFRYAEFAKSFYQLVPTSASIRCSMRSSVKKPLKPIMASVSAN